MSRTIRKQEKFEAQATGLVLFYLLAVSVGGLGNARYRSPMIPFMSAVASLGLVRSIKG